MNLKVMTAMLLAASMITTFTACANTTDDQVTDVPDSNIVKVLTAEEYTELYTGALDGVDSEMLEYNPAMTNPAEMDEFMLDALGMAAEDMEAAAISVSMMGVQAYGIMIVKPAEGSEQAVVDAMNSYVELQRSNFEMYLVDQYEIAEAATVEVLEDGTVLMVMCEDSTTVHDALVESIEAGVAVA